MLNMPNCRKTTTKNTCRIKTFVYLCTRFRTQSTLSDEGEVVEWSITAVLKTAVLQGTGGSNPSLSAFF